MDWCGGTRAVRALVACLAVLLPAAGWAAATVEPQSSTTVVAGGRAGATGLGDATALEEEIAPSSSTVTVSPATVPAATPAPATATAPTTKASNTSRTTTKPSTGAAGATLPPAPPCRPACPGRACRHRQGSRTSHPPARGRTSGRV